MLGNYRARVQGKQESNEAYRERLGVMEKKDRSLRVRMPCKIERIPSCSNAVVVPIIELKWR